VEIENVLRAVKAAATTKSELERLEAEKARLMAQQTKRPALLTAEKALPQEQFRAAVENLAKLSGSRIAEARRGLQLLLGGHPITLHPTDDGNLPLRFAFKIFGRAIQAFPPLFCIPSVPVHRD
jgi:hypothetical protein